MIAATGSAPDDSVAGLVTRARTGDQQAWDALIERYAPLVWSICRRHRLAAADADDVGQTVWLRLVDKLATIRDPAALAGWIATTTWRECGRLRSGRRPVPWQVHDVQYVPDDQSQTPEEELLIAERHAALREAFNGLPPRCQQLLALLIGDPSASYDQISATLGIPAGSIGPTRSRCLAKLRQHPRIAGLINAGQESAMAGTRRAAPR